MSAVFERTRKIYRAALRFEILSLFVVSAFLLFFLHKIWAISFFLGTVCGFAPHCFFVNRMFFRSVKMPHKSLGAFYRGEIFKWIMAIILLSGVFLLYKEIDQIAFFIGYIFLLILNNTVPMWLLARVR